MIKISISLIAITMLATLPPLPARDQPNNYVAICLPPAQRAPAIYRAIHGAIEGKTPGESAVVAERVSGGRSIDYEFAALIDAENGHAYLGIRHQIYISTPRGMAGISASFGGLLYGISRVPPLGGKGLTLDQLWKTFQADYARRFTPPEDAMNLGFPHEVVEVFQGLQSQPKNIQIQSVRCVGDTLSLSASNFDSEHRAEIEIDVSAVPWNVVHAVLDGAEIALKNR